MRVYRYDTLQFVAVFKSALSPISGGPIKTTSDLTEVESNRAQMRQPTHNTAKLPQKLLDELGVFGIAS